MQVQKILYNPINLSAPKFTSNDTKSSHDTGKNIGEISSAAYKTYDLELNNKPPKVFEGMTKKEIDFLLKNLHVIAINRGCSNKCMHCSVSANHAEKNHDNYVSKMPYEDYIEILKGIAQLREQGQNIKYDRRYYTSLFYDSDCMELTLYDKNGKEHDFTDIHKQFYDYTNRLTVFDSAGWNQKSPRMQERAEKYVNYLLENHNKFYQINLSMSPFHSMYAKAIELGLKGNYASPEQKIKAEKIYDLYTDRLANMLFTFTPLLDCDNFFVLSRPANDSDKKMKDFSLQAYAKISRDVIGKLSKLYQQDLAENQKYTSSVDDMIRKIKKYMNLLGNVDTNLVMSGRYKDLYLSLHPEINKNDIQYIDEELYKSQLKKHMLKSNIKNSEFIHTGYSQIIDTDGRVYMFDQFNLIPTELQLNISTKNKITPELTPAPTQDFILTREMINNL